MRRFIEMGGERVPFEEIEKAPEGLRWIPWTGEDRAKIPKLGEPVHEHQLVAVKTEGGDEGAREERGRASEFLWSEHYCYITAFAYVPDPDEGGWISFKGSLSCVPYDEKIQVRLDDGARVGCFAGGLGNTSKEYSDKVTAWKYGWEDE